MKKSYSKPDIFFEDFTLNTNITAGCEVKVDNSTDTCGVKWSSGVFIFIAGITGCTRKILNGSTNRDENYVDAENNGLCYHNPSDSFNVFSS